MIARMDVSHEAFETVRDKFDRARAQAWVTEKTAALNSKSPEVIVAMADFFDGLNATQQTKVREAMQGRHGWWRRG